ncbi:MAG: type II toxin-antitoxin system HicA family toxin [Defluviitaleaceae bacterium]|nr:type II toxin-antitoxin system HicA family toxin [Defluviitaleaceae bacterium]
MGSKYPVLKPFEVIGVLKVFGFVFKSQKGSHAKYVKIEKGTSTKTVIVPMHDEVSKGTLQSILEQSGLSLDEFLSKL